MSVRVTGGEFRGRNLVTPPGGSTRPTASRVREAIFSMLGPIPGARVLDLCCGCGSLGLEALSRGASTAVFVDDSSAAIQAVRENIGKIGLEERTTVIEATAKRALARLAEHGDEFDLVLFDPPYSLAPSVAAGVETLLPQVLARGARVVLEGDRRQPPSLPFELDREKRYRDVMVRIYEAGHEPAVLGA